MQLDIVIPKNNEEELYKEALSKSKIPVFLYSSLKYDDLLLKLKRLETFEKHKTAYLFAPKNPSNLNLDKRIRKKVDYVIGTAQELKTVRALAEKGKIDFLVNIETAGGRDHTHYRQSNFNQVIARICKENQIFYAIDFSRIRKVEGFKRAILLGRIMQNAKICKKEKVKINVFSFAVKEQELFNSDILSAFQCIL